MQFLIKRKMIFDESNIGDYRLLGEPNTIDKVMCSQFLNECIGKWVMDLLTESFSKMSSKNMYTECESPETLEPGKLLKLLTHLDKNT